MLWYHKYPMQIVWRTKWEKYQDDVQCTPIVRLDFQALFFRLSTWYNSCNNSYTFLSSHWISFRLTGVEKKTCCIWEIHLKYCWHNLDLKNNQLIHRRWRCRTKDNGFQHSISILDFHSGCSSAKTMIPHTQQFHSTTMRRTRLWLWELSKNIHIPCYTYPFSSTSIFPDRSSRSGKYFDIQKMFFLQGFWIFFLKSSSITWPEGTVKYEVSQQQAIAIKCCFPLL